MSTLIAHSAHLSRDTIQMFRSSLGGQLIEPANTEYNDARSVRNGLIDRYPRLIARVAGDSDVVAAVNFARDNELVLSIRGGGHNVAGSAVNDGGLVIDLSAMREVRVDPDARTVRVQGGATWADVDRETQLFGLAAPGGIISSTGVGGLSLHGGLGLLRRKFGYSIDNTSCQSTSSPPTDSCAWQMQIRTAISTGQSAARAATSGW